MAPADDFQHAQAGGVAKATPPVFCFPWNDNNSLPEPGTAGSESGQ